MSFTQNTTQNTSIIATEVNKLDANNSSELKEMVHSLHKAGTQNFIVNMFQTKYCDSSGLSALLMTNRIAKEVNGKFILFGLQPNVLKMIQIAQLDKVFTIVETENEATETLNN